ncbi:MAG: PorV/PorQ family protein [Ignavibacteriaceae bacterium]|nr:PorV/PorQ family protein [Ignavibacteriaceae bacterium]
MLKKLLILLIFSSVSYAQLFPVLGEQRAGISAAQFLKIGVGSRAAALGESFVAMSDDASALYWNPAALVQFDKNQLMFSHNEWLVDIKHQFVGGVYHLTDVDAVGIAVTMLRVGDMKVTTEFAPFGTGEYFTFSDFAIAVTYSRKMTDKFSFGGTVRYIEETLDKLKMRGILLDIGTYYWTGLGSTRFAVAFTNFGNQLSPEGEVMLAGNRKKSDWQEFSPPTMFRLGFAFEPFESENQKLTTSIQLNHPNDNSENLGLGAEYTYKFPELGASFMLRGGYKFNVDEQDVSLGAGVKVPISISEFTFDYAFVNFGRLGSVHRISLILGL